MRGGGVSREREFMCCFVCCVCVCEPVHTAQLKTGRAIGIMAAAAGSEVSFSILTELSGPAVFVHLMAWRLCGDG